MPRVCPRPCSRLAAAAVFISVGVVQFVVGIILLRSQYVYLLAVPDFWTSSCNIAVGCLLGLSASMWKRSRKRVSKKHKTRRNLLLALLLSCLMLNATTLGIFLLGKGTTLLSIHLEGNGNSHSTFAREVLAYAFVTSICCPIVCIVVSIVSMSGSCFKYASINKSAQEKTPVQSMKKNESRSLRWVYTPELLELSKKKLREFVLSSSSEFSSDDDQDDHTYHKYADSPEAIQLVLSHMAEGKRDTILSDSAIMLRQMDLRRKKLALENRDGSYIGPTLSRPRDQEVEERKNPRDHSIEVDNPSQRSENYRKDYSDINANTYNPSEDLAMDHVKYLNKSKHLSMLYKNPYASQELLNEYQSTAAKLIKHNPSQYKKFREKLRTGSEIVGPSPSCISDITDYGTKTASGGHKGSMEMDETDSRNRSVECLRQMSNPESSSEKSKWAMENDKYELVKGTPPGLIDCFSPDESDVGGEDSTFDFSRTSSWASEIVPISVKCSSVTRLSNRLVPVPSPVVPILQKKTLAKTSDDSGIGTMELSSFSEEAPEQSDSKDERSNLSSFREDSKSESEENMQRYSKVGPSSAKRYDSSSKLLKMAAISEESCLELNKSKNPAQDPSQDELPRKMSKGHYRKKSLSGSYTETSKRSKKDNSRIEVVPKRKSTLKKIWSSTASENQADILDQVVDEDSLIGLSEEELIARQFRTRSIRKVIEQRIKEKEGGAINT